LHEPDADTLMLTIGIKALNEEKHIAGALASAVRALAPFGGEVILADSGSTDRTIEIARQFPVRIIQLANTSQRSCGAGAQLAFQHARTDYFYLLDGDMELDPDFLAVGMAFLDANPDVAAVAGYVNECVATGEEFQIRIAQKAARWQTGLVDRLDGGGLYRTTAVRDVGYFADRNLHGFEEFELAARLQSRGWKLARIDHRAVDHFGYDMGGYRLLWRRLRRGYVGGSGEVLRGAMGERHLPFVFVHLEHVRYGICVIIWWTALMACLWAAPWLAAILLALPLALLSYRRRSFRLGLYSLASWNVNAVGLIYGFFRRREPPGEALPSIVLSTGEPTKTVA
jgi:glycosyltransferase involved in cell wall biosynthesis